MPTLMVKNIPARLHVRLKEEAKKHRRSMTQEAIVILERSLNRSSSSISRDLVEEKTST